MAKTNVLQPQRFCLKQMSLRSSDFRAVTDRIGFSPMVTTALPIAAGSHLSKVMQKVLKSGEPAMVVSTADNCGHTRWSLLVGFFCQCSEL
jgi:hypothetical protein